MLNMAGFRFMDDVQKHLQKFPGAAEEIINDVLHNEASVMAQTEIRRLMPVSGKTWNGKAPAAKSSNSLRSEKLNLALIVKTASVYNYLYFPNDGTNTKRHAGQQFFFEKGGYNIYDEVVDRCVLRLTNEFEKGV